MYTYLLYLLQCIHRFSPGDLLYICYTCWIFDLVQLTPLGSAISVGSVMSLALKRCQG